MSETPKCPYCGAEMELKYVCGEYFCLCAACESTSPARTSKEAAVAAALHRADPDTICQQLSKSLCGKGNATLEEMLEAAEQVKHRAEPEMRPLTMEEILAKANEEDWNFVWLEHKESRTPMQLCPWHRERDKIIFCGLPFDAQIAENIVEIRKTWRCWPRKPTPEQMAAEKWEE